LSGGSGHFLENLLLFGRVLRGLGLDVNPGRMLDLVGCLPVIDLGRRSDFYHATRSLLVHRREDIPVFDQAFEAFFRRPGSAAAAVPPPGRLLRRPPRRPPVVPPSLGEPPATDRPGESPQQNREPVVELTLTYSGRDVLRRKDFAELTERELAEVKQMMAELAWRLGERRTRRLRPGSGRLADLRRTLRKSLRQGGEIVEWSKRERKEKPRPLVVLADISGSMERYTRLLLHFLYGLAHGLDQKVEAFVFGTRLTRITRQLRTRELERAIEEVSRAVPDWAGGTRIGEALRRFNFDWGRRVLGRGAAVLLISDGWDRGEPELLGREMARLQRSCYRLIWLNPLLGSPEYEPLTRGMQAALPYLDDFLPVHNLKSLEELARRLAELSPRRDRRPARAAATRSEEVVDYGRERHPGGRE
jgi:uncharacterized protein with von Willebrand factor type A (vWA) domain